MSGIDNILGKNIRITAQVITEICQASVRKQVCPEPLSTNQFHIVTILAVSGEFRSSELATILDISPAATSKNIDRLEQLDLVARHAQPGDRRSHAVRLTGAGQNLFDAFERVTAERQQALTAQFSDKEKHLLLDMLGRIIRCILAEEHNADLICLQCGGSCGDTCVIEGRGGKCYLRKSGMAQGGVESTKGRVSVTTDEEE